MAKRNGGIIGPNNPTGPFSAGGVWRLEDAFNAQKAGTWPLVLGYQIPNSLRFNLSSADYLNRTLGTSTSRRIYTMSTWVKRSGIGTYAHMYAFGPNPGDFNYLRFNNSQQLNVGLNGDTYVLTTNALYRDVSAWYHVVCAIDTTQATDTNRVKLYVNGEQVTSFASASYPTQNFDTNFANGITMRIGSSTWGTNEIIDGYLAETYIIDGQALTPSSFGQTDSATGIWIPKAYTGTFGTNGFYLKFQDSSALGDDTSGNGNDFTVNNLTSVDQSTDTPTNNFATLNPLDIKNPSYVNTLSEGNLTAYKPEGDGSWFTSFANFSPSKGKWYWEVKPTSLTTTLALGIYFGQNTFTTSYPFDANVFYCHQNGEIYYNSNSYPYMASYTSNDIVTFALDMDNGKFYIGKNGSWANGTGSTNQTFANAVSITDDIPASFPTGKDVFPIATVRNAYGNFNFGSPPYAANSYADGNGFGNFSYAVPSGYYALCTKNLALYG
jgi:hypothetical protein